MKPIDRRNLALLLAVVLVAFAAPDADADQAAWSYAGANGPARWGKLDKSFATCSTGELQAPIDIVDAKARKGDIAPLLFNYKPSPLALVDDGRMIQVKFAPGSRLTLEGVHYELTAVEFHKPGEMKVDGKAHEMSAHLVHKAPDGKVAIVAVPLEQGNENAFVKAVLTHIPTVKGKEVVVDSVKVSAVTLLPPTKGYYAFAGSLTTPPCTENVSWIVMQKPVQISADQLRQFAKIYPMNARPVQPLHDRDIQGSL